SFEARLPSVISSRVSTCHPVAARRRRAARASSVIVGVVISDLLSGWLAARGAPPGRSLSAGGQGRMLGGLGRLDLERRGAGEQSMEPVQALDRDPHLRRVQDQLPGLPVVVVLRN